MKRAMMILVSILLLAVLLPAYKCEPSNLLELKEGMKYGYMYQTPPAGSDFDRQIDMYITEEDGDSWKGITAITFEDGTRLYRFKITRDDFELYETTQLGEKNIFDEEIDYKKITAASSESAIIIPLTIALNMQIYGFDMEGLIENKTVTTLWGSGDSTNLTLEGPLNYNNYNCYKIIAEISDELYSSSSTYYVSTVSPHLLIDQRTSVGSIENYVIINLETTELKSFETSEYIIDNPPNKQPQARFSYSVANLTVDFNASDSYDSDGQIVSYKWEFGDGTNGTGITIKHEYTKDGKYLVKLYVTDDENETGSKVEYVVINTSSTPSSNGEHDKQTPGFEIILAICTIAIVLFWKRKR